MAIRYKHCTMLDFLELTETELISFAQKLPGIYMLFGVSYQGIPSVAKYVTIQ